MRRILALLVLAAAYAAGTLAVGWLALPILGLVWGWLNRLTPGAALTSGVAAGLAWSALLAWTAMSGPLALLASKVGQIIGAPGGLLLAATLLFGGLLAWSATVVGAVLGMPRRG